MFDALFGKCARSIKKKEKKMKSSVFVWTFFTFALEQQNSGGGQAGNGIPGTKR
jgi:hypothetical protein